MANIIAGPVPTLVRQVSTVMDGSGVPEKDDSVFIPVSAGQGNLIYADPGDTDVVIGTAKGGLFTFEGPAQIRSIYASCGEGSSLTVSVVDGAGIKKGPKGTYVAATAVDGAGVLTHLDPSITLLPGQQLKVVAADGSGNMLVGVLAVKYPQDA